MLIFVTVTDVRLIQIVQQDKHVKEVTTAWAMYFACEGSGPAGYCGTYSFNWSDGVSEYCTVYLAEADDGTTVTATDDNSGDNSGPVGSVTFTCDNGSWVADETSASCGAP